MADEQERVTPTSLESPSDATLPPAPLAASQVEEAAASPPETTAPDAAGDQARPNLVPAAALAEARKETRAAKQYAQQLEATVRELYQRQAQPAPAPAAAPKLEEDPRLREASLLQDYYKGDQPDLERAQKWRDYIRQEATDIAAKMVQPIVQQTTAERSQQNRRLAEETTTPEGRKPRKEVVDLIWKNLDPAFTGDPSVAPWLAALAVGLDMLGGEPASALPKAQPASGTPPLHTESPGAARHAGGPVSDVERSLIGTTMTNERYKELTTEFKRGRPTKLEP